MSPSDEDNKLATFTLKHGKDYVAWSTHIESWFFEKNLWQHISGHIQPIPEPDFNNDTRTDIKKYFEWRAENAKAKNMMLRCLDLKYRIIIQDLT